MEYIIVMKKLEDMGTKENIAGMKRFKIATDNTFGVSIPKIRGFAKEIGKDHELALKLFDSGNIDARILASIIGEPEKATEAQLEKWGKAFDSWAVCDQVCDNFISHTNFLYKKINDWSKRKEEFIKRAAFSLIAIAAVHDKKASNGRFINLLKVIKREAKDDRNFVKKAVNWALRNIGKKNKFLNAAAIKCSMQIGKMDSKSAKWIASDAIRELKKRKFTS